MTQSHFLPGIGVLFLVLAVKFSFNTWLLSFFVPSSDGNGDGPTVVVVRAVKQDNKGQVECLNPALVEDIAQRGDSRGKPVKGSPGQATNDFGNKDDKNTRMTNESKENQKPWTQQENYCWPPYQLQVEENAIPDPQPGFTSNKSESFTRKKTVFLSQDTVHSSRVNFRCTILISFYMFRNQQERTDLAYMLSGHQKGA